MISTLESWSKDKLLRLINFQQGLLTVGYDLNAQMENLVDAVLSMVDADGAVVELVEGDEMVYAATSGTLRAQIGLRIARGSSLSGLCVTGGQVLVCQDSETDARVDRAACRRVGLRSMVVAPLADRGRGIGVIKAVSARPGHFTDDQAVVMGQIARLSSIALHNAVKYSRDELFVAATTDALTGAKNRGYFYDRLRQLHRRALGGGTSFAVLICDLDNLKRINDTQGHRFGDGAIIALHDRLRSTLPPGTVVGRLGGDEFGVLLDHWHEDAAIRTLMQQIRTSLEDPLRVDGDLVSLSASLGYSVFKPHMEDVASLVDEADMAMYQDKRERKQGRD